MMDQGPLSLGPNPNPQISVEDALLVRAGDQLQCVFNAYRPYDIEVGSVYTVRYARQDDFGIDVDLEPHELEPDHVSGDERDAYGFWIDCFKLVPAETPAGGSLADDIKQLVR